MIINNSCCGPCNECRISKYVSTKRFIQTFFEITSKDKLFLQCGENDGEQVEVGTDAEAVHDQQTYKVKVIGFARKYL